MIYQEQDLVTVAKRENNTKRNYLIVNRRQGKHIPVCPKEALEMFSALADIVRQAYRNERLLIIGFAETATAIGAAVAVELGQYYIQTTRENVEGVDDYVYFTEAHSHATEQKVVRADVESVVCGRKNTYGGQTDGTVVTMEEPLKPIDRIVFIEDEVTTGNTILSAIEKIEELETIKAIEKAHGSKLCFSVASILNGMDSAAEAIFQKRQIPLHYLVKIDHAKYPQLAENYRGDGNYMNCSNDESESRVKLEDSEINQFGEINGINKINQINKNNFGANKLNNVYYLKDNTNSICFNSACSDINYINNKCYYIDDFDNRCFIKEFTVEGCRNARRIQDAKVYQNACEQLCQKICAQIEPPDQILVLGTEEFMYPALLLAAKLEEQGKSVRFHATTRSPIAVSTESEYPLHARYELASIYDNQRRTFVYNLAAYNAVIIISDAPITSAEGKNSIYKALAHSGNQNITLVQWKE
ncbi:MAG: phosphoribosyltransferase domain-containing protein [Lachnospiraceae bacterium]|nr:phosphoribosyltransferase domain-containing protein [Lachnospiraceae bacterium]